MTIPKDNSQLENARRLRREMTPHECKLWYLFLRKYPVKIFIIWASIQAHATNSGLSVDLSWIFTALPLSWLSKWTVLGIMSLKEWHMTQNVPHFCRVWVWRFCDFPTGILTGIFVVCANKLTLPFKTDCKILSVTSGDSSPKGRAKASCNQKTDMRNGAYRYRYAPLTVLRTPAIWRASFLRWCR